MTVSVTRLLGLGLTPGGSVRQAAPLPRSRLVIAADRFIATASAGDTRLCV